MITDFGDPFFIIRHHDMTLAIGHIKKEVRRLVTRLTFRSLQPAFIIAWSLWRRAHQAIAKFFHSKRQL